MALPRLIVLLVLLALGARAETLHEAAARGDMIRVIQILDGGAKIDGPNANGETPLFVAVESKKVEIVKYLITRRADVNKSAPLLEAVRANDLGMARLLVDSGARVNLEANQAPLELAVTNVNLDMVRFLLDKKARATIKTPYGNLLHIICQKGTEAPYSGQKGRLEIARLLLAHEVDFKQRDAGGDLPFHVAVFNGHSALVDLFLDRGVKPDDRGGLAYAPLLVASEAGDYRTVQVLLEHKASVKSVSQEGSTALHKAAWNGHKKVVELLLRAGASPRAKNKAGKTPIDLARARGHKALVAMMKG